MVKFVLVGLLYIRLRCPIIVRCGAYFDGYLVDCPNVVRKGVEDISSGGIYR